MAKLHDRFYYENEDTKTRNISDVALAHRANKIANDPRIDEAQRKDAKLIKTLMETKSKIWFRSQEINEIKRFNKLTRRGKILE